MHQNKSNNKQLELFTLSEVKEKLVDCIMYKAFKD